VLKYLVCEKATNGVGCKESNGDKGRAYWRLRDFEKSFLTFVKELDLSGLNSDTADKERAEMEKAVQEAEGRLHDLQKRREGIMELFLDQRTDFLKGQLKEVETKVDAAEKEFKRLNEQSQSLSHEMQARSRSKEEILALIEHIRGDGEEQLSIRTNLRAKIRDLVERIVVHHDPKSYRSKLINAGGFEGRSFMVRFRDESRRIVFPSPNDPSKLGVMGWLPNPAEVERNKSIPLVEGAVMPWGKWEQGE
jgi:hypothetical protein